MSTAQAIETNNQYINFGTLYSLQNSTRGGTSSPEVSTCIAQKCFLRCRSIAATAYWMLDAVGATPRLNLRGASGRLVRSLVLTAVAPSLTQAARMRRLRD